MNEARITRPGKSPPAAGAARCAAALIVAAALLECCEHRPAAAQAPGNAAAAPAAAVHVPSAVALADTFARDTRRNYRLQGDVSWQRGRLNLGRGASLGYIVACGSPLELTADLEFPPLRAKGDSFATEIHLVFNGNHFLSVAIRGEQTAQGGGEIRITHSLFGPDKPEFLRRLIRRFPLEQAPRSGTWTVRCHYGFAVVSCDGKEIACGFERTLHEFEVLTAALLVQKEGRAALKRLAIGGPAAPPPLSAAQKDAMRVSARANADATRLALAGRYAEAVASVRRAVQISQDAFGPRHPWTIDMLGSLAIALDQSSDAESLAYYDRAVAAAKEVFGQGHPREVFWLTSFAMSRTVRGDLAAIDLLRQALAIESRVHGEESPQAADLLAPLANAYLMAGQAAAHLQTLERATAIYRRLAGNDALLTASFEARLVQPLSAAGRNEEARRYGQHALQVYQRQHAAASPDAADLHVRLAHVALGLNDPAGARREAEAAEAILAAAVDPSRPDDATFAQQLGAELTAKVIFSTRRYAADSFLYLGFLQQRLGNAAKALACYRRGQGLYAQAFGDQCGGVVRSLSLQGSLHLSHSQYADARGAFAKALAIQTTLASANLATMSDAEARQYVVRGLDQRDLLLDCLRKLPQVPAADAYQVVWDTRSIVARFAMVRAEMGRTVPAVRQLRDDLCTVGRQLASTAAAATFASADAAQAAERARKLRELSAKKELLERAMARQNPALGRLGAFRQVGIAELARRLPRGVAVVDFLNVMPGSTAADPVVGYHGFVLRKSDAAAGFDVSWETLGSAAAIDESVRLWRRALLGGKTAIPVAAEAPERRLRRLVWDKLEPHLRGCTTILILPDGALARVPWPALPGRKAGTFLLEDYAIAVAGYGQQLALLLADPPGGSLDSDRLLLVGNIDYGVRPAVPRARKSGAAAAVPFWPPLSGTTAEIDDLEKSWGHPQRLTRLEGSAADKNALVAQMPAANYVHLATHGCFVDADFRKGVQAAQGGEDLSDTPLQPADLDRRNPMLFSSLVLAGANRLGPTLETAAAAKGDATITAEEIASLDLSKASLVVLSACETGLGEAAPGEGVYGFQRAFGLAGARTVVASLWRVDDQATRTLMAEFYQNLWHNKLGKLESLRQAQLTMLRNYDPRAGRLRAPDFSQAVPLPGGGGPADKPGPARGGRLSPAYWAAFVLSGDWR